MASARKAVLCSAYYIFAWTAITVGAKDVALIRLSYEGLKDNINNYTFNSLMFENFHSFLCNGNAAKCVAHYQYHAHSMYTDFYTADNVYDEGNISSGFITRTYSCTNGANIESLTCEQQSLQALPDFLKGEINSQSLIIPQSACGSTCVVLLWQLSVEKVIFDDSVGAVKCSTNCACPSTATTTIAETSQQLTISTSDVISIDTYNVANTGNKTTQEDTPVSLIIGVIIVLTIIVTGIIIWGRRRAASGVSEKMHHQMNTSKESSGARARDLKSKNSMDGTSNTQSSTTDNLHPEGETYAVPHKTKHQKDFIPTGIAKNGTNSAISTVNQQGVNAKNAPDNEYPRVSSVPVHRNNTQRNENNTIVKEDVKENNAKQTKTNKAEDDFGYAFAEVPPDQVKDQKLNFNSLCHPSQQVLTKEAAQAKITAVQMLMV